MAPSSTSPPATLVEQIGAAGGTSGKQLWTIATISGKGKGLIATQDIAAGTLLLSEAPLITTEVVTSLDMDTTEAELSSALQKLPVPSQEAYRSLHNNYPEDEKHLLSGIVRSNAYPLGADAEVGGVFPNVSRINHSCLPNVVQYWNPILEKETVYAVRPIMEAEEITTSYHAGGSSKQRKDLLRSHFGFDCTCTLCSLPPAELEASDKRLDRAEELDATIGNSKKCHFEPEEVLKSCRSLHKIFEEEGIKDGRLARVYYDAFQLCNMHSDLARARCFAKYYCDAKKTAEGSDSLNVLEIKPFVKNPTKHKSYGSTELWKSSASDLPKGLGPKEFAKWLWRESV